MVRTPPPPPPAAAPPRSCCGKIGLKKGAWTPEEDRKLVAYITRYRAWNWRQLPKFAGLARCGKSCRLRWMNYLRPDLKRGNFSNEEEDLIIKLHESIGNRWSTIAAQLPGRTDNEIKNHWHTSLKKRSSNQVSISKGEKQSRGSKRKNNTVEKRSEYANSCANTLPHQILESSQFSPPPMSSNELCSVIPDAAAVNEVSPSEMFAEISSSFWTEPFLSDSFDTSYDVLDSTRTLLLSPNSPVFFGEEFQCSYSMIYDEGISVLNW